MIETNKIYHADSYELIKQIPDKTIDLIVTDPPYLLNNDGGGRSSLKSLKKFRTGLKDMENDFDISILEECIRISKRFHVFIFCSNKQISKLMSWGESKGFTATCLIWYKYNAVPFCNGTWRSDIEYIIHIREKGAFFEGNALLKSKVDVLPIVVSKHGHPVEKPIGLIEKYIKIGSKEGDIVFDPFSGSGTTAIACHNLKRKFICIEKDFKYHKSSIERLMNTIKQLKLDIGE